MSWLQRLKDKLFGKRNDESAQSAGHDVEELIEAGWALIDQGAPEPAIRLFDKALASRQDADVLHGRGTAKCMLQRYFLAIDDLNAAIELRPRFPQAITERGMAYVHAGNIERGMQDYDAALALDPSYAVGHFNKGAALCLQERWREALGPLNRALVFNPQDPRALINLCAAHQMLDDIHAAALDAQRLLASHPSPDIVAMMQPQLENIQAELGEMPSFTPTLFDRVSEEVVLSSSEATVADLIERVNATAALFVAVKLGDERHAVCSVYGATGLRDRLSVIADLIGPASLSLRLDQIHDIWIECAPIRRGDDERTVLERLQASGGCTLVTDNDGVARVLSMPRAHHYPQLPTAIFGPEPLFERNAEQDSGRQCATCGGRFDYLMPVMADDMLETLACPSCEASPTSAWIAKRMRPGGWSRVGFLGEQESLSEVIAADDQIIAQLGLSHQQLADALGKLLDEASAAYSTAIDEATEAFNRSLLASGQRGVNGLATLPLQPSLDEVEAALRRGELPPEDEGVRCGAYQVFLQVSMGYQECPFTILHRPWSDERPPIPISVWMVGDAMLKNCVTGLSLLCRTDSHYFHADRDFLIVRPETGDYLRGAGLMVHLVGQHHFFQGYESPYRLEPERVAKVLGLLG